MTRRSPAPALAAALLLLALPRSVRADEGMWLFNEFPKDLVKARHGFEPSNEWLDHLRLASVRIAGGCSASIVSPQGLVLTNHHCAHECIEQLSTKDRDYVKTGFYAKTRTD